MSTKDRGEWHGKDEQQLETVVLGKDLTFFVWNDEGASCAKAKDFISKAFAMSPFLRIVWLLQ